MNTKCEKCGQEATSQIEWETNGEIEKHFYCDSCYYKVNPSETYGKNSKFYSEIRNVIKEDTEDNTNAAEAESQDNGLDESGVPFEYSSESDNSGMPKFLFEQLGKLESILAVEFFAPKSIEKLARKPIKKVKKNIPSVCCPGCGLSLEDITVTQKAGCAKCYQMFDGILMQKHSQFGDGKNYNGKNYKSKLFLTDIDYIQTELNAAVKNQDFERAAFLRDEMCKLQKKAKV